MLAAARAVSAGELDRFTHGTHRRHEGVARVRGRKASDKTIELRFRRYGRYAGLAFWLFLTRDWVAENP